MTTHENKENPHLVTVFYSNSSGNSKALLQFINNSKLMDKLSIKFINIDNNEMKNIIKKKFSVVPSIVVIQGDEISLYVGDNAFEWFNIFMSTQSSPTFPSHPTPLPGVGTKPKAMGQGDGVRSRPTLKGEGRGANQQSKPETEQLSEIATSSSLWDAMSSSLTPIITQPKSPKSILEIAKELSMAREKL
jgi:hypothetical protein